MHTLRLSEPNESNRTSPLRLATSQVDWGSGTLDPSTLPAGIWKRPSHLFQVLIVDHTIENPDGSPSYYPYVYNTQDETTIDNLSLPAGIDILQTRVGTFMMLPDLPMARKGVYTLAFQTALIMLAWRTALVPDPQRFAGAMTMVTHILRVANPGAVGILVNMRNKDGLLRPSVTIIKSA